MLVQFSKNTDEWETPNAVFKLAEKRYGSFLFDVAAQKHNSKCLYYSSDSLHIDWTQNNWCNPPFSLIGEFIDKAVQEACLGKHTTMICKAATETKWFLKAVKHAKEIVFLTPRVHYIGAGKSAPFASCFIRFDSYTGPIDVCWLNHKTGQFQL